MAKFFLYLKEWIWDLFVNGIISSYLVHFKVRNIFYYIAGIKKISVKKSAIHARCYISGKNIEIKVKMSLTNGYLLCIIDKV